MRLSDSCPHFLLWPNWLNISTLTPNDIADNFGNQHHYLDYNLLPHLHFLNHQSIDQLDTSLRALQLGLHFASWSSHSLRYQTFLTLRPYQVRQWHLVVSPRWITGKQYWIWLKCCWDRTMQKLEVRTIVFAFLHTMLKIHGWQPEVKSRPSTTKRTVCT